MSEKAKAIQNLYRAGRISEKGVREAAAKGLITQGECDLILGV